jgi:hypothetical protein
MREMREKKRKKEKGKERGRGCCTRGLMGGGRRKEEIRGLMPKLQKYPHLPIT